MKAKKIFKVGCLTFVIAFIAVIVLGTIANRITAPVKKKIEVQNEIRTVIDRLNQEAPYQVGVATWFTGATYFINDTLMYNIELRGNKQMEALYVNNQKTFRDLTLLAFRMGNEQGGLHLLWVIS